MEVEDGNTYKEKIKWWNEEVKGEVNEKRQVWKKYLETRITGDMEEYKLEERKEETIGTVGRVWKIKKKSKFLEGIEALKGRRKEVKRVKIRRWWRILRNQVPKN